MRNINKKILLIVTFMLTTFLIGCDWEKEVEGPRPCPNCTAEATPIKDGDNLSFHGRYLINNATIDNGSVDVTDYLGGIYVTSFTDNNALNYYYLLQHKGYKGLEEPFSEVNNQALPDFTLSDDNLSIIFNTPLTLTDNNGSSYSVKSIRKYEDGLKIVNNETKIEDIDTIDNATICDPNGQTGMNCDDPQQALKYIGSYRIEKITCNGLEYTGGVDFAGEMGARAYFYKDNVSDVRVPIAIKFQVSNGTLKTCILTADQQNSGIFYSNNEYKIDLTTDSSNGLAGIFAKVGLIGLTDLDEETRTTQIDYSPKNTDYTDMTFNSNTVTMRLRIMRNGGLSKPFIKLFDSTTPYFSVTQ